MPGTGERIIDDGPDAASNIAVTVIALRPDVEAEVSIGFKRDVLVSAQNVNSHVLDSVAEAMDDDDFWRVLGNCVVDQACRAARQAEPPLVTMSGSVDTQVIDSSRLCMQSTIFV